MRHFRRNHCVLDVDCGCPLPLSGRGLGYALPSGKAQATSLRDQPPQRGTEPVPLRPANPPIHWVPTKILLFARVQKRLPPPGKQRNSPSTPNAHSSSTPIPRLKTNSPNSSTTEPAGSRAKKAGAAIRSGFFIKKLNARLSLPSARDSRPPVRSPRRR
jgi:hypothetical protein